VYFGPSATPALAGTVPGTRFEAANLTAGTTYYWRVVANNASGSASSGTWSFTVGSGQTAPSSGPTLVGPANGATDLPTRTTFQWTGVQGATAYDFYLGTSASALSLLGSAQGASATVRGLQRTTTYYWKVVARMATASASSTVASFTTR